VPEPEPEAEPEAVPKPEAEAEPEAVPEPEAEAEPNLGGSRRRRLSRVAASPSAVVAAGLGVAIGEGLHLRAAASVALGVAGWGARLAASALHRRPGR
jgi:hypothetical protein